MALRDDAVQLLMRDFQSAPEDFWVEAFLASADLRSARVTFVISGDRRIEANTSLFPAEWGILGRLVRSRFWPLVRRRGTAMEARGVAPWTEPHESKVRVAAGASPPS